MSNGRNILFVRSGGGMPGLDIHAGIWLAMENHGINAAACSGTSAGALVSGADALGWNAASFSMFLDGLDDEDVREFPPLWAMRFPWLSSIMGNSKITKLLDTVFPEDWAGFTKPVYAWACNAISSRVWNVARPEVTCDPSQAFLASMSIPGIFPMVKLGNGLTYFDGGTRFNLPLLSGWKDYDEIYLLIAGTEPKPWIEGEHALTALLRNFEILAYDQIDDIIQATEGDPRVRVIWPIRQHTAGMLHFDHDLINLALHATNDILSRLS